MKSRHSRIPSYLIVLFSLLVASEARAATRYVAKTGTDNPICAQAFPCLTINHAVAIALPGDTISIGKGKFPEHYGVTISKNLTIAGAGTFSTQVRLGFYLPGQTPVFTISPGTDVTITGLDVMGGDGHHGGGIMNDGNLTLQYVRIWKNSADDQGGGIWNSDQATLNISRTEIAHNSSPSFGAGLYNAGIAILDEVRVVANQTGNLQGGGIFNFTGWPGHSNLIVTGSEISYDNGIGILNHGHMSIINTTVSHNSPWGIQSGEGSDTELTHVTVAANGSGGGLRVLPGDNTVELKNTIIANNTPAQCQVALVVVTATGSLVGDGTCGVFPGGTNQVGVDPQLGPLKWNGGSTHTHALKKGSPAIDAGSTDGAQPVDQRGVSRPIDGDGDGVAGYDIGAFEYDPVKKPEL